MTEKEIVEYSQVPVSHYLFARVLGHDDDSFMDSDRKEELRYAFHVSWIKPLVDQGYLEQVSVDRSWPPEHDAHHGRRRPFNYYKFKPTDAGIRWWVAERVKVAEADGYQFDLHKLVEPTWDYYGPTGHDGMLVGKGIGSVLVFRHWDWSHFPLVFLGLRDGLFQFQQYYAYNRAGEEWVSVTLTENGMRYFDSLPRLELQLECG